MPPQALIYALIDPCTGRVRYVGQTHLRLTKRIALHIADSRRGTSTHSARWLRSLGHAPIGLVLEVVQGNDDTALDTAERKWIAAYRDLDPDLTNHSDGGQVGHNHSPESRAKMSLATQLSWADPATRERRLSSHARTPPSPDGRRRIAEFARQRWKAKTTEERAVALGYLQQGATDESRRKMSVFQTERFTDPEARRAQARRAGLRPYYDEEGNRYYTLREAAVAYGVSKQAISRHLRGVSKTAAGHVLKYEEVACPR